LNDPGQLRHFTRRLPNYRHALLVVALLLLGAGAADAGSVKQNIFACREEINAKKRMESQGQDRRTAGVAKTTEPCSDLPKGMTVTIERTDGQLVCVRPWGGLECLWTEGAAIDQNAQHDAPASSKPNLGKAHFNGFKPSFTTQF
jgi:hypothetical protein